MIQSTGHSRALRERLRDARVALGMTQGDVGKALTKYGVRKYTGAAVSQWEKFDHHPPVNVMAAWARAVGLRLVVDISGGSSLGEQVLVPSHAAEPIRRYVALDERSQELVSRLISVLPHMDKSLRFILDGDLATFEALTNGERGSERTA